MNPSELLVETQRAAGDPRLSGWHKILIEARNIQKTRQTVRNSLSFLLFSLSSLLIP